MSINKIYLNQKYNTIYYPFSDDGNYSNNFTIKKYNNFGNEKRVSIGGGKVESTDFADTLYYGQYCKARAILGFDTSTLDKSISANSPVSMLRLYNLYKGTEYTPASITIEILPLTGDGSAGTQTSADLTVTGGSSWEYKNSSEVGGDNNDVTDLVDYSLSASAELTPSNKHIEVNISTMINYCLENDYRIYGVVLKLTSEQESSTANSYFIKNIYTGDFTMLNKLPRIDITTTNYIHDDRNSILAGQSSRLYFYNMVNGTPSATNADSASVTIVDRDETTIIDSVSPTADSNNTGYYYVDFTFPVSAGEQNGIYNDKGTFNYDGTSLIKTGEFNVTSPINNSFEILDSNKLSLVFIKEENKRNMHVKLKVKENKFLFFNKTSKEDDANNYNIKEVYYRVYTFDTSTGEREKGYVSDWDRMSYDKESIGCDIDKTIFPIGKYFIEFKFNLFGKELYYADKKYFFSIEEDFINTSLYY